MTEKKCDIAIIGAGPGGYTAAIRASQLGYNVILIEKRFVGGICLNVGCIPTKAILSSVDILDNIKKAKDFGIEVKDYSFDLSKIIERKDLIVKKIRTSLKSLIISNKIEIVEGKAQFINENTLKVTGQNSCKIQAKKIIIASGSEPSSIQNIDADHKRLFYSNSLLCLKKLPSSLAIIGGGYIGCEFASFYSRLGVKVTIIEALDSIISLNSKEASTFLTKSFMKQNIDIKTNSKVTNIEKLDNKIIIHLENNEKIESEIGLIAIGRKAKTKDLDLEKAKITAENNCSIKVNNQMQTSNENIYAIGDVIGSNMLAHVASHQALIAIDNIHGKNNKMQYNAIPSVIFTNPEIASAGITKEEAIKNNIEIETAKFPFSALGKAIASSETEGYVLIIIDKKSKVILGAEVVGKGASILIGELNLAITNKLTSENITETIHTHPTLPESIHEAALISLDLPINFPKGLKL